MSTGDEFWDSDWNEAKLKFLRLHLLQEKYNAAFVVGDFVNCLAQLDVMQQELRGHLKPAEFTSMERFRIAASNAVNAKRINNLIVCNALRNYSNELFLIRTERKMDIPRKVDPGKRLLEG